MSDISFFTIVSSIATDETEVHSVYSCPGHHRFFALSFVPCRDDVVIDRLCDDTRLAQSQSLEIDGFAPSC